MSAHTQRSLALAKIEGWETGMVERWLAHAKPFGKHVDLFGIIDVVAIRDDDDPSQCELGIQSCPGSGHATHRAKALAEPRLRIWLGAGNLFEIWSWSRKRDTKILKDGTRTHHKVWTVRKERITLLDLGPRLVQATPQPIDPAATP